MAKVVLKIFLDKYFQDFILKNKGDEFWRNDEWESVKNFVLTLTIN